MHEKHRSLSTALRDSHSSTWKPKRERQIINATVSWGIKFISIYSNSDNQRKVRVVTAAGVGVGVGGGAGRSFKNNSQETEKADVPRSPLPVY